MKAKVLCKLPKAGLGNQLFPLMHACLFARLNGLQVMVTGYHQLKLGPYLRGEKSKRKYQGYFTFQRSVVEESWDKVQAWILQKRLRPVYEQQVRKLAQEDLQGRIFIFEKLPTYQDYFIQLRDHRDLVRELLYEIIKKNVVGALNKLDPPVIGVHIRMGDFRKLREGEIFAGGHVRTPLEYFTGIITGIRKMAGRDLPVSLFSDGYPDELAEVTRLANVTLVEGNTDLVDLLLLSRSKVIVTTTGSTFSYWAAFLSDAEVILHPDHMYAPFRPLMVNQQHYEGPYNAEQPDGLLLQNIRAI